MKQQTAVEWLAEKLLKHAYKNEFDPYHGSDKIIARAKKMEEKQLKNCWWDGFKAVILFK